MTLRIWPPEDIETREEIYDYLASRGFKSGGRKRGDRDQVLCMFMVRNDQTLTGESTPKFTSIMEAIDEYFGFSDPYHDDRKVKLK